MNYLKYFLFSLIILWLFGFLYVFRTGSYGMSGDKSSNSLEQDNEYVDSKKQILASFKDLENELKRLEAKNEKNELIIKSLQLAIY
jgi:hypothetical protein